MVPPKTSCRKANPRPSPLPGHPRRHVNVDVLSSRPRTPARNKSAYFLAGSAMPLFDVMPQYRGNDAVVDCCCCCAGAGGSVGGGAGDDVLAANDKFVVNIVPRRTPPAAPTANKAADSSAFGAKNATESFGPREGAARRRTAAGRGEHRNCARRSLVPPIISFSDCARHRWAYFSAVEQKRKRAAAAVASGQFVCMHDGGGGWGGGRPCGRQER